MVRRVQVAVERGRRLDELELQGHAVDGAANSSCCVLGVLVDDETRQDAGVQCMFDRLCIVQC
jgi:hypothetical protein